MIDLRSGSVPVEAGELYYERVGEGFPVVLLHGALWDRRIWDPQIAAFAALYPMNARPVQEINRRFLLGSF